MNRRQQAVIAYLQVEHQSLPKQLGTKRVRWTDEQRRRLAEKAKAISRSTLVALGTVVTPDTLLRWYRNLVAAKYDGPRQRGPGRASTKQDIVRLVIRMARENPSWGYARIRGALFNLGHDSARNTIKAILKQRGIEPAPERGRHTNWHTSIKSHFGAIAGADIFTVEVLRGFGLVRYYVFFFVLDIGSRRVHIAGITDQPGEACTKALRTMLKDAGAKILHLTAQSPNLNSYAERWIRGLREECLSRIIPLGEQHLRQAIASYVDHYHMERNHQGLGIRLIELVVANTNSGEGRVRRR